VGNGYDLSINKYKKSAYVEETYPHPREILAEINALEMEIQDGLRELEALVDG
jgi:type I restriction enzyme M protein